MNGNTDEGRLLEIDLSLSQEEALRGLAMESGVTPEAFAAAIILDRLAALQTDE